MFFSTDCMYTKHMRHARRAESGYTLVELLISIVVLAVISSSFLILLTSLLQSATLAKQKSVANALANNQMEYLRSLPYDSLAVSGGSILASSYLPAETKQTISQVTYTVTTDIRYVDDAFDGCGVYPSLDLKKIYCRNFSAPGNSSGNNLVNDTNPADYKIAHITIKNGGGTYLAVLDTNIAARVAETASTTGALFVTVTDPGGNAVTEASVNVVNAAVSPSVNISSTTDSNGVAIFYGLPPDTQQRYSVTSTKSGYSTISTIAPSGSLQPTYAHQKILTQQSSQVLLVIGKMSTNSLVILAEDTTGKPLSNIKLAVKGGYKKYTNTTNTAYYYDNLTPSDTRGITDASGMTSLSNLPPINDYIFCGDKGDTGCISTNGTKYYLAAAAPYNGTNSLMPITVPQKNDPVAQSFSYDGQTYPQQVKLILTTNSAFPRVRTIDPDSLAVVDNLSNVKFVITGNNLTNGSLSLSQNSTTFTAKNCTGSDTELTCAFNLTAVSTGTLQATISANGGTLTLPVQPLGGISVK